MEDEPKMQRAQPKQLLNTTPHTTPDELPLNVMKDHHTGHTAICTLLVSASMKGVNPEVAHSMSRSGCAGKHSAVTSSVVCSTWRTAVLKFCK